MKKLIYILLISLLILNCSKNDEPNREYVTTCYRFIEKGSGAPIPNLNILVHYGYSNVLSSQGITNSDGEWCFEHWNDEGSSALLYQPMIIGYWDVPEALPLNGSTNTIELIPKSWIKFQVVNIEPSDVNDRVDVSFFYWKDEMHSFGGNRPFEGNDIDTFWWVDVYHGVSITIEWKVYQSGVLISTHGDVITLEQSGDVVDYLIEY